MRVTLPFGIYILMISLSSTTIAQITLTDGRTKHCVDAADEQGMRGSQRDEYLRRCEALLQQGGGQNNAGINPSSNGRTKHCVNAADEQGMRGFQRDEYLRRCEAQ